MTDKKSFLLYVDYDELFSELSDVDAGQLIKHIFDYVNDRNPKSDNPIVKIAFISIKKQFKRDLAKWQEKKETNSIAGKEGNLKRWHPNIYEKYKGGEHTLDEAIELSKENVSPPDHPRSLPDRPVSPPIAKIAVTDTVTVKDTVTVSGNVKDTVKDTVKVIKKKRKKEGETSSLFNLFKSEFIKTYQEITGNEYYYDGKSAGNLKPLIAKIKHSIESKKEKGSGQKENATDDEVIGSLNYILLNLPDWYKENLSIAILNSKYNELINQLRNGKNSSIRKDNAKRSIVDKVNAKYSEQI